MQQFTYTIQDPVGIHARPAGLLAVTVKPFADTTVTISKGRNSAHANQVLRLMTLGIKQGDTITVTAEGSEEVQAAAAVKAFLEKTL